MTDVLHVEIPTGLDRKNRNVLKKVMKKGVKRLFPFDLFTLPKRARTTYVDTVTTVLLAEIQNSSIEHIGSTREGPSQDRVMDYLQQKLSVQNIEMLMEKCAEEIAVRMKKLRRHAFKMAIDFTNVLYYGNDAETNAYVTGIKPTNGTCYAFVYCVLTIVTDGIRHILYSYPVKKDTNNVMFHTKKAINFVKGLGLNISNLFLDREFYVAEVVDFLHRSGVLYLIPAVQNDKFKRTVGMHTQFPEKLPVQIDGYEIDGKITATTTLVIMEETDEKGKKHVYGFITNLSEDIYRDNIKILSDLYGKRWGIETTFRVQDNFNIYTTTRNGTVRYFFFVFSCVLYNLWVTVNFIPQKNSVDTGKFAIKLKVNEMKDAFLILIGFDFRSEKLIQAKSLLAAAIFDVEKDEMSTALFSQLRIQNIGSSANTYGSAEMSKAVLAVD